MSRSIPLLAITLIVCIAVGLGLRLLNGTAQATGNVITVCPGGCDYPGIGAAVAAANDGDLILVSAGTYSGQVTLSKTLTIQGAGILSTTVDGEASGRLFDIQAGATVTLAMIALTNGRAPAEDGESAGGAIFNLGSLRLISVTVHNNWARGVDGDLTMFDGGNAYGGGIYNGCAAGTCGAVAVRDSRITGNYATGGDGYSIGQRLGGNAYGGGLYNDCARAFCGRLSVANSIIAGNNTIGGNGINCGVPGIGYGGGIYNGGVFTLTTTTVKSNSAVTGSDPCFPYYAGASQGGGIYNGSSMTLSATAVVSNYSTYGGGMYLNLEGSTQLANSTVSGNEVYYFGGGVYNAGHLSLVNATIAGNVAGNEDPHGGGAGGGLYNYGLAESANSLLASNKVIALNATPGPDCFGPLISRGHNLIENPAGCTVQVESGDIIKRPAHISPLGDNGGPTPTHALKFISPALDAADLSLCPAADQRGVPRPADGDGDYIPECDIGAYEGFVPPAGVMYMPAVFHQGANR